MKKLAAAIAAIALIGTPAFAQAPPPVPAPVPTWTGFYGGIQFGGGWSDEAVNFSGNDPVAALLLSGSIGIGGEQPVANGYRIPQSGPVGGVEAGYNWQWSNWLLGLEADFSGAGISGTASGTSVYLPALLTQTTTAEQSTDWYGTVRAGWLATPKLLLFGTGGFAYGRVADSANYALGGPASAFPAGAGIPASFSFNCLGPGPIQRRSAWLELSLLVNRGRASA